MPVYVIDTLKPKNGLDFPVVEAVDVAVEGYASLADAVTHFATDTAISALTTNLQAQIDQIAQTAGTGTADTEIGQARVGADGSSYNTLKARLDGEYNQLTSDSKILSFGQHLTSPQGVYVIKQAFSAGDKICIAIRNVSIVSAISAIAIQGYSGSWRDIWSINNPSADITETYEFLENVTKIRIVGITSNNSADKADIYLLDTALAPEIVQARTGLNSVNYTNISERISADISKVASDTNALIYGLHLTSPMDIYTLNQAFVSGTKICISLRNVHINDESASAIAIQGYNGSWQSIWSINNPHTDVTELITIDDDYSKIRIVGITSSDESDTADIAISSATLYEIKSELSRIDADIINIETQLTSSKSCTITETQQIYDTKTAYNAGDIIGIDMYNVSAKFTGEAAISIQKKVNGSWSGLIAINSPKRDGKYSTILAEDVEDVRVVGLISTGTVEYFHAEITIKVNEFATVGNNGAFTSILTALKSSQPNVELFLDSETFDIYQEYIDYYGADFWSNYEGYALSTDPFYRGLWLARGRKLHGSSGTKLTFNCPERIQDVAAYFSIIANNSDILLENLTIDIGFKNVRYAIHDDFQPQGGTVEFRNIIFNGTANTSAIIGAGLGVQATYIIDNCIFENNTGTYDISYHGNTDSSVTDNISKITVSNCCGNKKCWFGWYGSSLTVSDCIVHNSQFSNISCSAYDENQVNENMRLIAYCNA